MPDQDYDVAVAGGGIVGLATARELLSRYPSLRLLLLEREAHLATQQTGHNSGVIHSGIYYAPGSLKARLCVQGRRALVKFCDEHAIRYHICGKLIVATRQSELERLQSIYERAAINGVENVEMVDVIRMHEIEPHVVGLRAVYVGCTGIVNFKEVAAALADDVRRGGGDIRTGLPLGGMRSSGRDIVLETPQGAFSARHLITCGGLFSDRLARLAGAPNDMRIIPFRGDYYLLKPQRAHVCRALIYPVPDPSFPFLGVHFTRKLDGSVWVGPNAVLAFARQGYGRWDFNWKDLWETLTYPGFWKLAAKHWRVGLAEMWRDYYKPAYVTTMREYIPEIRSEDVEYGPSGVRAQAVSQDGRMVDDFSVYQTANMLHVRNAPSPAATSCLAIAGWIVETAGKTFQLTGQKA